MHLRWRSRIEHICKSFHHVFSNVLWNCLHVAWNTDIFYIAWWAIFSGLLFSHCSDRHWQDFCAFLPRTVHLAQSLPTVNWVKCLFEDCLCSINLNKTHFHFQYNLGRMHIISHRCQICLQSGSVKWARLCENGKRRVMFHIGRNTNFEILIIFCGKCFGSNLNSL